MTKAGLITDEIYLGTTGGGPAGHFAVSIESITKLLRKVPSVKHADKLGEIYI
jgi:hypothetical protein